MVAAPDNRGVAVRLGGAVAVFLLLVGQAQVTVLDGSSMLAVAQSIVHHASLSVPPALGVPGHDGLSYSKYGLLLPLLSVIPVLLAQPVGALTGRVDLVEAAAAASLMPLVGGTLAAALFALGRRLGAPRPAAVLVAAGTVLGTYLLPYGRDFFTEPLVALGLVVMVERALAGRDLQAGAALACAILARPQSAAFAPLLLAFLLWRGGGGRAGVAAAARSVAPLAVAVAVQLAYNLHRFHDALQFGYAPPADPGFTTPLLHGAGGLLFSAQKSIVLFAPALLLAPPALLALWRRDRGTAALLLALFAAAFALAAAWWSWQGGWSWGPRLVIPGVALVLVALGPWLGANPRRLRLAGALFAIGFVVSLPAVIAPAGAQLLDRDHPRDGPGIARQYDLIGPLAHRSADAAGDRAARHDDYRRYLALWQANAVRQLGGRAVWPALLGTLALLAALAWLTRDLTRRTRAG
jgi:hypothetical protein